jgi:hypothetical protein
MATDSRFIKMDGAFARPSSSILTVPPGGFSGFAGLTPVGQSTIPQTITANQGAPLPSTPTMQTPPPVTPNVATPAIPPTGIAAPTPQAPATNGGQDPNDIVNNFMLGLVKSAQGVDVNALNQKTLDLQAEQQKLEREQNARNGAAIPVAGPNGDYHFSPAQLDAIRNGSVSALGPLFDANKYEQAKNQQKIDNYNTLVTKIAGYSTNLAEKMVAPDSVITAAVNIIEGNPDKMSATLSALPNDATRTKVLAAINPDKLKDTSAGATYDEQGNMIDPGNYSTLEISRLNTAANKATTAFRGTQVYKFATNAPTYISKINAAAENPGSVSDQELLDAITQLNTGGGRVTEGQVHIILNGKSLADSWGAWTNKLSTGGVLSDAQRQEVIKLAQATSENFINNYDKAYQPLAANLKKQQIPEQFWGISTPQSLRGDEPSLVGTNLPEIPANYHYDYETDYKNAEDAIAAGKDPTQVWAYFHKLYK